MQPKPKRGARIVVSGREYLVTRVYPFGTCDAMNVATGEYFRLTGLGWV